jgi:hypothetical protein
MLPGFKAFKVYKGDTFAFSLTLGTGGNPYPITSHTFIAQIKEKSKKTVVAEFNYTITNANNGVVTFVLPAEEAAKLNGLKIYEYDIQMTNAGVVSTILKGPMTVVSDVVN